ncbi:YHYH protein, partial [Verrucomicrobia bacterium]|nr:YHYH protein [Verrucomicrobiota bacterium]
MKAMKRIGLRWFLAALWVSSIVGMVTNVANAHEWHRHHDEAGEPAANPVFQIPADEGAEPENSATVAERAEAFSPFHPRVRVRWDDQWFYIESDGIADHDMMTGITNWQQQIPVPQYYYGDNAWQIPLKPTPAATSTPVSADNLLKGAYAIAVNGIPIFNLYNNRGENTADIGELDQWGGHCGRADDYHYHIVPHQLGTTVGETAPLAYALDGYPIYGSMEPDGADQNIALDSNMGHSYGAYGYHYHALESADYSIPGLYGEVTVSGGGPENQIEPQPRTSELRPALTPLRGASITAFSRLSGDAFSLSYELSGQNHEVNWSMDRDRGEVTYEFVDPTGTTSDTYTSWQAGSEAVTPTLTGTYDENGLFQFDVTGTPGISYPFAWTSDLVDWKRFGFLLLDDLGQASFTLAATGANGFLGVEGSGETDSLASETDPGDGETDPGEGGIDSGEDEIMSITQGAATTVIGNLYPQGQRVAGVGTITASDGTTWTVPADTQYQGKAFAPDLFNSDNGVTPTSIANVDLESLPIVEIDADGEIITGYIFADNYFELYVNGTLVGIDPIPFTEFNSNIVRFRAKAPITYAFKLVDWEENLGLGSESNRGNAFHPGDAGLIASFSDGTVTGADWKAQTFYIAPVDDPNNVVIHDDGTRDSSAANQTTGSANSYGLHWRTPDNWFSSDYNDSSWPSATTFSNETVGVDNKPSFTNFEAQLSGGGAQFIWSSNLVLDNEVIVRYTTGGTEATEEPESESTEPSQSDLFSLDLPAFESNVFHVDATCEGAGVSPSVQWTNAPIGTESFAILVTEPNGPDKWWWMVYDIPNEVSSLQENETSIGTLGTNSVKNELGYEPPCFQGSGTHTYRYTLYALSVVNPILEAPENMTRASFLEAVSGVTIATAEFDAGWTRIAEESTGTTVDGESQGGAGDSGEQAPPPVDDPPAEADQPPPPADGTAPDGDRPPPSNGEQPPP